MSVIRQATRCKPKKRIKQDKYCLRCSRKIDRGKYCKDCYRKRCFAFWLAEALKKRNLIEVFKEGKLTKEQREEILKEIRPENTRYSFDYFADCLQIKWPDTKATKKLQELGF